MMALFQLPSPAPASMQSILLYDGDCALCLASVRSLQAWGLMEQVFAVPVQQVVWMDSPESADWQARSRAEILLFNASAQQGVSGFDAIRSLLGQSSAWRGVAWGLGLPMIGWLGERGYQLVAMNRRRLSPTRWRRVACHCDPPPCVWAAWSLYGLCLLGMVVGLLWPWRVVTESQTSPLLLRFALWFQGFQWTIAVGWVLLAGLGCLYWWRARQLPDRVRPWLEQAGLSIAAGSVLLLLWRWLDCGLVLALSGLASGWLAAIRVSLGSLACLMALGVMGYQFQSRLMRLGFIRHGCFTKESE